MVWKIQAQQVVNRVGPSVQSGTHLHHASLIGTHFHFPLLFAISTVCFLAAPHTLSVFGVSLVATYTASYNWAERAGPRIFFLAHGQKPGSKRSRYSTNEGPPCAKQSNFFLDLCGTIEQQYLAHKGGKQIQHPQHRCSVPVSTILHVHDVQQPN